jgi:regulator of replication initiation timing
VLELDDDQLEIYNEITTLVNGIEDLSVENTDLKKSLDRLRKNLNNRPEVTTLVVQINDQIED